MKFAVIGAGPVGLMASYHLLYRGFSVTLISRDDLDSAEIVSGVISELKPGKEGLAAYDLSYLTAFPHQTDPNFHMPSKIIGGFANVWGATWGRFDSLNSLEWQGAYDILNGYLKFENSPMKSIAQENGCTCFNPIRETGSLRDIGAREATLAINHGAECSCLSSGMTYCTHGNIFDGLSLFDSMSNFEDFSFFSVPSGLKYESSEEGVRVVVNGIDMLFDQIFLAAGPVGTAELILENHSDVPEITLADTQMIYIPVLNLFRKKKHKGSYAFSQFQCDVKLPSNVNYHFQLYSHPELYEYRILNFFPTGIHRVIKILLGWIYPWLNIAIIYLDSSHSESVSFLRNQAPEIKPAEIRFSPLKKIYFLKSLFLSFLRLKMLWLWPLRKYAPPGASFHSGASNLQNLDDMGCLKSDTRICVTGAFTLPYVLPGPITHSAMANAIRQIEYVLKTTKI